jgi:PadR family transcriptional regulator PadR
MLTVRAVQHDGRLRKYYHITPEGVKRMETFKEEWKEILSIYQFVTKGEENHE